MIIPTIMCGNKDLFGNDINPVEQKEKPNGKRSAVNGHKKLIELHGITPGMKCKTCDHLIRKSWDKAYFKCELFRNSNGPATDWRVSWQACGKYVPEKQNP